MRAGMRRPGSVLRAAAVAAGLWLALAPGSAPAQIIAAPGAGEVRALVVGVNRYDKQPTLKGAVADAEDLERTLRKLGVRDLKMLRDGEATRAAVIGEMGRLLATTKKSDLVIFSFAGHGTRLPEFFPGSNPSDEPYDEVFLLPGFEDRGPGTAERVLDKEVNAWLRRLEEKGATVLFIADSCHGGGLLRTVDPRVETPSYRQAPEVTLTDDRLKPVVTARDAREGTEEFTSVTFVAAVDPFTKAPEVRVPGQPSLRGAISFAIARAFEGGADRNGDGVVTRRELIGYTRQQTQQLSEGQQTPVALPRRADALDVPVFRTSAPKTGPAAPDRKIEVEAAPAAPAAVKVAVLNGPASALAGLEPLGTPFTAVDRLGGPNLLWDARTNEVLSPIGDVLARDIRARDLPDVVDRIAAVAAVQALSERRMQPIAVQPNAKLHREGERVSFEIQDVAGRNLILFNIAGDGTVQYLYPRDKPGLVGQAVFALPLDVTRPYGADLTVAVVSDERLTPLEDALARLNNRRAAGRIPALLAQHLAGTTARIGHATLFSGP